MHDGPLQGKFKQMVDMMQYQCKGIDIENIEKDSSHYRHRRMEI